MPGRHPLAAVHVEIDPRQVDVNVHPRKAEVRFAQERAVYQALLWAVEAALSPFPRQEGYPTLDWPFVKAEDWPFGEVPFTPGVAARELAPEYVVAGGLRVLGQLRNTYIVAQEFSPGGAAAAAKAQEFLAEHGMATALVRALSERPVRNDVAMTGELTLTGRVLPIGGLKEKVLGACRAGISEIVLPKENEPDIEDIPEEVRRQLSFRTVEMLEDVLVVALHGVRREEGKLVFDEPAMPGPVEPGVLVGHDEPDSSISQTDVVN